MSFLWGNIQVAIARMTGTPLTYNRQWLRASLRLNGLAVRPRQEFEMSCGSYAAPEVSWAIPNASPLLVFVRTQMRDVAQPVIVSAFPFTVHISHHLGDGTAVALASVIHLLHSLPD